MKVIFTVVQLQIELGKDSEAPTEFEPMTSTIPVRCSTNYEALLEAGHVRVLHSSVGRASHQYHGGFESCWSLRFVSVLYL